MKLIAHHVVVRLLPILAVVRLLSISAPTAAATVPTEWTVRIGPRSASYQAERRHGDALNLRATLTYNGQPLAYTGPARLYAQTNGMGSAWWDLAPCTVSSNVLQATWLPSFDTGADVVDIFLGGPSNYQAAARIRFLPSPGSVPNSLPLPAPTLDFATVQILNPPYYTRQETDRAIESAAPGDYSTVSNRAMSAILEHQSLEPSTNYTDRALGAFADTGTVERARGYGTPTRWTDATGCVWEVNTGWRIYTNGVVAAGWTAWNYQEDSVEDGIFWSLMIGLDEDAGSLTYAIANQTLPSGTTPQWDSELTTIYNGDVDYNGIMPGDSIRAVRGETNLVGRAALTNDIPTVPEWAKEPSPPSYSAADVGAAPASIVPVLASVSNDAATAKLNSETALRIVLGESVWFAVTNYMRTAEGVIPSLQLWEVRDGATNLVYDSREEITNTVRVLTSELRDDMTNRIHAVSNAIPSKAWGNYQSDGTDNPEPGKVAIINQPTVILTGGGTFNKYVEIGDSSIWVLTSSGPVSFGGGTNGNYFAVLDDEGNAHFKVSKTDSFDVPAIFSDNPRVSGDALLLYICSTNRQGEEYIGPPTLSACTNLQAAVWHDEADGEIDALGTSVAWARNDAIHAWVGTVTQDRWATMMFFRAKIKQDGGTAIINTAPMRFDGGIQLGDGTYRLVPYTTGGKTYLTVEGMP